MNNEQSAWITLTDIICMKYVQAYFKYNFRGLFEKLRSASKI